MTVAAVMQLCPAELRTTLVDLRHELHRYPELSFQETRTADVLTAALGAVQPASLARVAGTGVVCRIAGRERHRPAVAIRGDIDALPIQEETGVEFASRHDGVMHACGHDVHATWAVGAAHLLAQEPAGGDVLVVLQPAEETGRGAAKIIEAGVLNDARAIFGGHVDTRLPVGSLVVQAGPLAASTDSFDLVVTGRGAHAARPHEGADPIVAAAAIVTALQTLVSRRLTPGTPAVVTVGSIHAGTAPNVIPDRASMTGTLRAADPETRTLLSQDLIRLAADVAAAHGVSAAVEVHQGTPALLNDQQVTAWAAAAVHHLLGDDAIVPLPAVNMAGEDFACYLERVPGCFVRIGARLPGTDVVPTHTSRFLPADEAIFVGAAVLAEAARRASSAIAAE